MLSHKFVKSQRSAHSPSFGVDASTNFKKSTKAGTHRLFCFLFEGSRQVWFKSVQ